MSLIWWCPGAGLCHQGNISDPIASKIDAEMPCLSKYPHEEGGDMTKLTIGNRTVALDTAIEWVRDYTSTPANPKKPYAYPAYDTYDTGASDLLVDADLLAPVLLNVRLSIAGYESLQRMTAMLNEKLAHIAPDASILDTSPLKSVGGLYTPLDERPRPHGIKGTTLSKVLHRKRPGFIPLFDREVRACYAEIHGGTPARIPPDRSRSWSEYMGLIADEIRNDLLASRSGWDEVASANKGDHPITTLRCFDIVAWNCGKRG